MTQNFETAIKAFLDGAQTIVDKHYADSTYHPKLEIDPKGIKFVRIVRYDYPQQVGFQGSSVHCFIDKTNGDVLKAAGWKAPAKHARGNIYAEDQGLQNMGPYGPAYLR